MGLSEDNLWVAFCNGEKRYEPSHDDESDDVDDVTFVVVPDVEWRTRQ